MGAAAYLFCLHQKILFIPSSLFAVTLVALRHMFFAGGISMFLIAAPVKGDAFVFIINLYCISIIYCMYTFAYKGKGNTVMMPVFPKGDMIVLLHFGLNTVMDIITGCRIRRA